MQSGDRRRGVLRAARTAAVAACCAAATSLLAACGGGSARTVTVPTRLSRLTSTPPARLASPPARPRRRAPTGPPVGTAQQTVSDGAHLTVTVERLIDPLRGSGASLTPGTRAVAILVTLVNAGPALYDSSATGDFSLAASRGQVTPVFVPTGLCQTPVEDFDRYMAAGEQRSGCVAFAVPGRAHVVAVRFSPHARRVGRLTWVPASSRRAVARPK